LTCAWKVLNLYLTQAVPYDDAKPGAAIAVYRPKFWPPARRVIFKILIGIYMCWPHNEESLENLARGTCPP
jgi:hypothetical protein